MFIPVHMFVNTIQEMSPKQGFVSPRKYYNKYFTLFFFNKYFRYFIYSCRLPANIVYITLCACLHLQVSHKCINIHDLTLNLSHFEEKLLSQPQSFLRDTRTGKRSGPRRYQHTKSNIMNFSGFQICALRVCVCVCIFATN